MSNFRIIEMGIAVTTGSVGQVIGSFGFGCLGHKTKVSYGLFLNSISYIVLIFLFLFFPYENLAFMYLITFFHAAFAGAWEIYIPQIAMGYSQDPIAGSLYNYYASWENFGNDFIGAILIAQVATIYGYPIGIQIACVYLILGSLQVINPLRFIQKNIEEKEKETKLMT